MYVMNMIEIYVMIVKSIFLYDYRLNRQLTSNRVSSVACMITAQQTLETS